MTNNNESKLFSYFSSQSHILSTELPNPSTSMMIISAEYSSKKEWDKKLKPIHWEINSKVTSSESPEAMMVMDLP